VRDDDISIPPVTGEASADLDDRFFAEGEAAARAAHAEALQSTKLNLSARTSQVDHAEARLHVVPPERRKRMTRYVKVAVGLSAALCLAGFVSRAAHLTGPGAPGGERSAAAAQLAPPPVQAPVPVAQPAVAAAPLPPPVDAVPPPPPADEVAAEPPPPAKSAKEEKEDARKALERGKRQDAIDAGQRSVDLDPTDAEAWLILGSAQQEAGHWKEARESFVACTKQAKAGPIGECRMMLR
jgi:tetratricopeptide (TPR) repeat protein